MENPRFKVGDLVRNMDINDLPQYDQEEKYIALLKWVIDYMDSHRQPNLALEAIRDFYKFDPLSLMESDPLFDPYVVLGCVEECNNYYYIVRNVKSLRVYITKESNLENVDSSDGAEIEANWLRIVAIRAQLERN